MHEKSIVHRDIKPDNFIITKENQLKLIDFNVARKWNPQVEKMMTKTGTDLFKAPELFMDMTYDYKVDIWSSGVVFFMMASNGKFPFYHDNLAQLK